LKEERKKNIKREILKLKLNKKEEKRKKNWIKRKKGRRNQKNQKNQMKKRKITQKPSFLNKRRV
jgi:hypothetical protein